MTIFYLISDQMWQVSTGRLFDSQSMERFRASFIKYCCPVWWKIDWKKLDFFGNLKNVHFFPCKKKGVCIAAKAPCVILYIRRPYIFNQGTRSSGNRILASNTRNTGLKKTRQIKLKPCIFFFCISPYPDTGLPAFKSVV